MRRGLAVERSRCRLEPVPRAASVAAIRSRTAVERSDEPLALALARGDANARAPRPRRGARRPPRRSGGGPPRSARRCSSASRNASSATSSSRSRAARAPRRPRSSSASMRASSCVDARPAGRPAPPGRPAASRASRLAVDRVAEALLGRGRGRTASRGTPCSASASARAAAARASAAASTSPSSASSRSRAVCALRRGPRPSRPVRRSRSREQRPESGGGELARERRRPAAVSVSCFFAISACCCSGFSWRRSSASTSCEPQEVLVEAGELALGPLLAAPVLRDPRGLLDVLATVLRLRERAPPRAGPARRRCAARGRCPVSRQELLDVQQPDDLAVDPVLGLARAEDRAADLDLGHRHGDLARGVVDHELDLGHAERGARRRAREDHVGHLPAAERPRRPARRAPS